ncbi:heme-thiolate peroxidase, partial [Candolleomyces efflorescens]
MSLPEAHPALPKDAQGKTCPVTGATHEYRPPQEGDSRSPCPALNTMANHGYIPRDGKRITPWQIVKGLRECYGLTTGFSIFLSYVTWIILRKIGPVDLYEIGKHNAVEHDASLVHHNTPAGEIYAPIEIDRELLDEFEKEARTEVEVDVPTSDPEKTRKEKLSLLTITDVGRARVRREKESPLDKVHAEIARGEVAIILGVWETKTKEVTGTRMDWLKLWLGEEKLPEGWRPTKKVGMFETMKRAKGIRTAAEAIRKEEATPATEQ